MSNKPTKLHPIDALIAGLLMHLAGEGIRRDDDECDDYCEGCPGALPLPLTAWPKSGEAYIADILDGSIFVNEDALNDLNFGRIIKKAIETGLLFDTSDKARTMSSHLLEISSIGREKALARLGAAESVDSDSEKQDGYTEDGAKKDALNALRNIPGIKVVNMSLKDSGAGDVVKNIIEAINDMKKAD